MWTNIILCIPFISAIVFAQNNCKVIINEINVNDPKKPEKRDFIELKSTCGDNLPLRGYKLVGFNCKKVTGTVDLVVTLWNERMNQDGFFTIGGSEVPAANLKVSNDFIKFRNSFISNSVVSITNFVVNGIQELRAIGLLYDDNRLNPFDEIVLSRKQPFIRIDDKIVELFKQNLIDLVVYGEKSPCDKCSIIEKIHNEFAFKQYALREFPTNKINEDISLNRCAFEPNAFLPEKFKLGNPTPGKENDCGFTCHKSRRLR